jgi:hypothetical protein
MIAPYEKRKLKLGSLTFGLALGVVASAQAADKKPNILVIRGDDIGTWNINHNNRAMMGYKSTNIDRIARKGVALVAGVTKPGLIRLRAARRAYRHILQRRHALGRAADVFPTRVRSRPRDKTRATKS